MKDEYDFSTAERGSFHRPDAIFVPPVHRDPEVLAYLTARAEARGVSLSELVNALLKKDIELIEAAEQAPARRCRSSISCRPNSPTSSPMRRGQRRSPTPIRALPPYRGSECSVVG